MTCCTKIYGPKDFVEALLALTKPISHKDGYAWENEEDIIYTR